MWAYECLRGHVSVVAYAPGLSDKDMIEKMDQGVTVLGPKEFDNRLQAMIQFQRDLEKELA